MNDVLHLVHHDAANLFYFRFGHVEVKFIVHLHNHQVVLGGLRSLRQNLLCKAAMDTDHRYLDDVGSRSLNRGIDGIALRETAYRGVAAQYVGQITPPAEKRFHLAVVARELFLFFYVVCHAGEGGKIVVYQLLCLLAGTA